MPPSSATRYSCAQRQFPAWQQWLDHPLVDTDWTAALLDVWPDGRAFNVADGIIRARHREGNHQTVFLATEAPHHFEIDMGATSQVFLTGQSIRVDVSSSNFPRYDRNPGADVLSSDVDESHFVAARQTVFLDAQRASFISLTIVDH